jgi:hypothetical protein
VETPRDSIAIKHPVGIPVLAFTLKTFGRSLDTAIVKEELMKTIFGLMVMMFSSSAVRLFVGAEEGAFSVDGG